MTVFVALLRAVNVGRTGRVDMAQLCAACEAAGLRDVTSYINSGNLLFSSDEEREAITARLGEILTGSFGLSPNRVVVLSAAELQTIVNRNPFGDSGEFNPQTLHVHFLLAPPAEDADLKLTSYKGPERVRRVAGHIYIDYPNGVGTSGLTASYLEKAAGAAGTARNWNTCTKLLELAGAK